MKKTQKTFLIHMDALYKICTQTLKHKNTHLHVLYDKIQAYFGIDFELTEIIMKIYFEFPVLILII